MACQQEGVQHTFAFIFPPTSENLNPSLPLARTLVRRGHAVHYLAYEQMREAIEDTGAVWRSAVEFQAELFKDPQAGIMETYTALLGEFGLGMEKKTTYLWGVKNVALERKMPGTVRFLRELRPSGVVYCPLRCVEAMVAAEVLGIPSASLNTIAGPGACVTSLEAMLEQDKVGKDDFQRWVNSFEPDAAAVRRLNEEYHLGLVPGLPEPFGKLDGLKFASVNLVTTSEDLHDPVPLELARAYDQDGCRFSHVGPLLDEDGARRSAEHGTAGTGGVPRAVELLLGMVGQPKVLAKPQRGGLCSRLAGGHAAWERGKVLLLCVTWASLSVCTQVLNKMLVTMLKAPALISVGKMWIAMVLVGIPCYRQLLDAPKRQLMIWMIVPPFYAAMVCTQYYTMEYMSLSFYTVLCSMTPLVVLPIERAVMPADKQPKLSWMVLVSMLIMVAGAIMYGDGVGSVSVIGCFFAFANVVTIVGGRLMQRRLLTNECSGLASAVCAFMNNTFGSIPVLILAGATHEISDMSTPEGRAAWTDPRVLLLLVLSGVIGTGMNCLGYECQRALSATSFLVLQNVSRVGVVVCGTVFFQDPIKSPLAVAGLAFSIGGNFAYGKVQMSLQDGGRCRCRCRCRCRKVQMSLQAQAEQREKQRVMEQAQGDAALRSV